MSLKKQKDIARWGINKQNLAQISLKSDLLPYEHQIIDLIVKFIDTRSKIEGIKNFNLMRKFLIPLLAVFALPTAV